MPRLAAALLACMVLLAAGIAQTESQRRIVVLQPDQELLRAVSLALSPWGVETIRSDAPPPPPSQPEAVQVASRLAHELGVEAVVWVSSTERGSLLWVFDAHAGDITTRIMAETPPFDSAASASVALSIKTVLRASVVAPPAEQFGARSSAPLVPASRADRVFAIELGAGGYWVSKQQSMLRFDLAAVAWIAAERRFGVTLDLSSGPSLEIDEPRFRGRYREVVAAGKASCRLVHEPDVSAALAFGGALHWSTVEGQLLASSLERSVSRLNASLDLETSLSLRISRATYLGASIAVAYSPAYRRYLVEGGPIFSPSPVAFGLGGHCGVEIF